MFKQRILATVVALFSLFIVFGGWFLTNELLDRQHVKLMNKVNSIDFNEKLDVEPGAGRTKTSLSTKEIANILKVWTSDRIRHYHEPYEGQLTMEEAINAANSWLSYFCKNDILPKEILESDFTQTNAFLYDTNPVSQVPAMITPAPDPAYSFWSVNLINREVSVQLMINALTGEIWMVDISSSSLEVNFDNIKVWDVLEQYEKYFGLFSSDEPKREEAYASKSYENNQIGITVYKKAGESGHYGTIHFSLTSTH
ncbi:hypothetical protein [Anaerosacchariphilus polymeriproducens]|uniref:Uncharacterized protein n=1 Tax=Anaerosacchariphilus polymeriproducens TaxID=1812858 RepID=A0A371AYN8_9FIRM|nr:hypothetical protein [Anaerosacchariphilus polymeriproducens]RDU24612.1 hypothetical protein DWV06_03875 [Anaerosacchariphilus polymeriproducens]